MKKIDPRDPASVEFTIKQRVFRCAENGIEGDFAIEDSATEALSTLIDVGSYPEVGLSREAVLDIVGRVVSREKQRRA